jgi:hypothetical protein
LSTPVLSTKEFPPIRRSWTFTLRLALQLHHKGASSDLARLVEQASPWPGWQGLEGLVAYLELNRATSAKLNALPIQGGGFSLARNAGCLKPGAGEIRLMNREGFALLISA